MSTVVGGVLVVCSGADGLGDAARTIQHQTAGSPHIARGAATGPDALALLTPGPGSLAAWWQRPRAFDNDQVSIAADRDRFPCTAPGSGSQIATSLSADQPSAPQPSADSGECSRHDQADVIAAR